MKKLLLLGTLCMAVGARAAHVVMVASVVEPVRVYERISPYVESPMDFLLKMGSLLQKGLPIVVEETNFLHKAMVENIVRHTDIDPAAGEFFVLSEECAKLLTRTEFAQKAMEEFSKKLPLFKIKIAKDLISGKKIRFTGILARYMNKVLDQIFEHDKELAQAIRTSQSLAQRDKALTFLTTRRQAVFSKIAEHLHLDPTIIMGINSDSDLVQQIEKLLGRNDELSFMRETIAFANGELEGTALLILPQAASLFEKDKVKRAQTTLLDMSIEYVNKAFEVDKNLAFDLKDLLAKEGLIKASVSTPSTVTLDQSQGAQVGKEEAAKSSAPELPQSEVVSAALPAEKPTEPSMPSGEGVPTSPTN